MTASPDLAPTCAASEAEAAQPSSAVGLRVQDRYVIEEELGRGGMGTVYRARHIALDRPVALKALRSQHSRRWVSLQRFEREARALAKLSHPNVVSVTDYGIDQGAPFLVMELLEGESLHERLGRGRLERPEALRFALELLEGLAFAHERGLVHRDIKPANVFVERMTTGAERIKLLDFGLAKFLESSSDVEVTRSGELWGTPAYMAPEQITAEGVDARTDVYAAGHVVFEMLVGQRAFQGSEGQMLQQHMVAALPSLAKALPQGAASPPLDRLLARATAKEPDHRFRDAGQMAQALRKILEQSSSPRPERAARAASPGLIGRALRAGALLVSLLAFAAIVVLLGLIYLLQSEDGAVTRDLLERALPGLFQRLDPPSDPKSPQ